MVECTLGRGRRSRDGTGSARPAETERGAAARAERGADDGVGRSRADRLRIWAPIALRAAALGIALLGLAGIGSVMGRGPAPSASPPGASHAELGLGALSERALAVITSAGTGPSAAGQLDPVGVQPTRLGADAGTPPPGGATPPRHDTEESEPSAPGSATSAPCRAERRGSSEQRSSAAADAPVVLNRADAAELRRLPGVGAKRAEAILALRERLGRFRRPSDLLRVKGIGPRTLERMLPHLVLD